MREGAVIDYQVRVTGAPLRWRTVIERWVPGTLFVDSQHRGPYRSWFHEHRFRASGPRTVMDDVVYFAAPLGPVGRALSRLVIAAELRRIFGYRAAAIGRRFGGHAPVWSAA
jgi:ligand-binding SRPBCC domain-containing protein